VGPATNEQGRRTYRHEAVREHAGRKPNERATLRLTPVFFYRQRGRVFRNAVPAMIGETSPLSYSKKLLIRKIYRAELVKVKPSHKIYLLFQF